MNRWSIPRVRSVLKSRCELRRVANANTLASYVCEGPPSPNSPSVSKSPILAPLLVRGPSFGRMRSQRPCVSGSGRVPTSKPLVEFRSTFSRNDLPLQKENTRGTNNHAPTMSSLVIDEHAYW